MVDGPVLRRDPINVRNTTVTPAVTVPTMGNTVRKYLTVRQKVQKWNEENVKIVIRDNLYPLAKIVFNSEKELQYGGDICNVIMENVKFDDDYTRMTIDLKEAHQREMWSVWSTMVSKGQDSKRHNQKASMRRVFWGKCIVFFLYDLFSESYFCI